MSAAVIAALKKVAVSIFTNPKVLKTIGGIVLGIIIIIVMPFAVVFGIFSGDIEIDMEQLKAKVEASMTEEQLQKQQEFHDTMVAIEVRMQEAGHSMSRIKEAQVIYVLVFSDTSITGEFLDNLVGCFVEGQTDEELIAKINDVFGVQLDPQDFIHVMNGIRRVYIETGDYYDAATKNNLDLVKFAIHAKEAGWGYVWGTYGEVLTEQSLEAYIAQYPDEVGGYEAYIRNNWLGGRTADCGGLIKGYAWLDAQTNEIVVGSNGMPVLRADELYEAATEKGDIQTIPEIEGLGVWKQGHIGVYIGNGQVIEAMSTSMGVVQTELVNGSWTHWLKIPNIMYIEEE